MQEQRREMQKHGLGPKSCNRREEGATAKKCKNKGRDQKSSGRASSSKIVRGGFDRKKHAKTRVETKKNETKEGGESDSKKGKSKSQTKKGGKKGRVHSKTNASKDWKERTAK